MKKVEYAKVISNTELKPGIFDMRLRAPFMSASCAPGQFVMVYTGSERHMLPRPISVCGADKAAGELRIVFKVVGAGTELFSRLHGGATLRVLGPLGNGFPVCAGKRAALIGGGIGVPPLLALHKGLSGPCVVFLGDRDAPILAEEFMGADVHLASDSGQTGFHGTAVELAREIDPHVEVIYACGPKPMLRAVAEWAEEKKIPAYLSMEERMACGIGACVGCAVGIDRGSGPENLKVCKDGPVFLASEVIFDD